MGRDSFDLWYSLFQESNWEMPLGVRTEVKMSWGQVKRVMSELKLWISTHIYIYYICIHAYPLVHRKDCMKVAGGRGRGTCKNRLRNGWATLIKHPWTKCKNPYILTVMSLELSTFNPAKFYSYNFYKAQLFLLFFFLRSSVVQVFLNSYKTYMYGWEFCFLISMYNLEINVPLFMDLSGSGL